MKGRFKDKKTSKNEDGGPSNREKYKLVAVKAMDKQPTSILKRGQEERKSPVRYADDVKGGKAMSSKSALPHVDEAQKSAKGEVEE